MPLSVVVASYKSHATLRRCLESLAAQPLASEIVVADCSPEDPAPELHRLFPRVKFLHFDKLLTIPQLRWAGYAETSGDIVASTEGRCIPSRSWCAELLQAHAEAPEAPAVGGPIDVAKPASAYETGLYFCEYGWHSPPVTTRRVRIASGANISYKRRALEESRDLIDAAAWEWQFHDRWLSRGLPLYMSPADVVFVNSLRPCTAIRQRFHYGRGYGADRLEGARWPQRVFYAASAAVLPALMIWRLAKVAGAKGRIPEFVRAVHWVALLSTAWSAGEMTGYLLGPSSRPRVY